MYPKKIAKYLKIFYFNVFYRSGGEFPGSILENILSKNILFLKRDLLIYHKITG